MKEIVFNITETKSGNSMIEIDGVDFAYFISSNDDRYYCLSY